MKIGPLGNWIMSLGRCSVLGFLSPPPKTHLTPGLGSLWASGVSEGCGYVDEPEGGGKGAALRGAFMHVCNPSGGSVQADWEAAGC